MVMAAFFFLERLATCRSLVCRKIDYARRREERWIKYLGLLENATNIAGEQKLNGTPTTNGKFFG